MRLHRAAAVLCLCALLCHAQVTKTDQEQLTDLRARYDAPFQRNLQSFTCDVEFSWKQHFKETVRVGDEGTDKELETLVQPIRNHVTVTANDVTVDSGLTEADMKKLPYNGMAEGLLQHAVQKSLANWLPASHNAILPDGATPVTFTHSATGHRLAFKMQGQEVEMLLTPDLRLQSAAATASPSDRFDIVFAPGPQGYVLSSWTMGEDGDPSPGHRLIFSYTYQTVDGFQLPDHVAIVRESHQEIWRYRLIGCHAKTTR